MKKKITFLMLALLWAGLSGAWAQPVLVTENLIAHFKADGLTAGPIGTWTDTSGSGNHVTQENADRQPTVVASVLNGLSVVRFDGSNNMKKGAFTAAESQPNTIFIVWKSNATGFRFAIGGGFSNATTNAVYQGTGEGQNIAITTGTSVLSYNRTLPFQFLTTTAIFNGANSKIYENGVHRTTGDAGSNPLNGLVIGSLHNDDRYLIGDIAEILIYNSALNDTDRKAVEEYLRDKWFRVFVYDGTTNELKSWHATIQGGINAAAPGDLVEVTAGTYYESLLINKPIIIQGAGIGQSIIDGSTLASATALVRITGINSSELLFDGFTIQNTPLISTGGNRNPVMIHDCDDPAKITFTNNHVIGSGEVEEGVNQWGVLLQYSTAEFVVNHNTFDGIMNNAILVERAVGPVELGHNTFNVPDWEASTAIWSMSYGVGAESWNVTGLHRYHNNIIRSHNPTDGIRRGIGVASAWGTSWGQRTHGAYSNLVIESNIIEHIAHRESQGRAINLEIGGPDGGFDGVQIKNNTLSALTVSTDHISRGIVFFGPIVDPEITENSFTDFYEAIRLHGTWGQPLYPSGVQINGNNLATNHIAIKNTGNITANATCNYWGTDEVADIGAKIEGPVNWSEILVVDTENGDDFWWDSDINYSCIDSGLPFNADTGTTSLQIQPIIDHEYTQQDNTIIIPTGTYDGFTDNKGVKLDLGSSPGCATVTFMTVTNTTTFIIDIAGDDPCTGYDQWIVQGDLNLNNALLEVKVASGYKPAPGKKFIIFTSPNDPGEFSNPTLIRTNGHHFILSYEEDNDKWDVVLTSLAPLFKMEIRSAGSDQ